MLNFGWTKILCDSMTTNSNIIFRRIYFKLHQLYIYCAFLSLFIAPLMALENAKTCHGVREVHADNIDSFKGCNIIIGSVTILDASFSGFKEMSPNFTIEVRHAEMHPIKLEVFKSATEISGCLMVGASHPEFTNLSFFRNLQQIGGKDCDMSPDGPASLYIKKTSLKSLNMRSLKQVSSNNIFIKNNEKLCFVDTINFGKLLKTSSQFYVVKNNGICSSENCDSQCSKDGCWGPLSNDCFSCKAYQLNSTCVEKCDAANGVYDAGNNVCEFCHVECLGPCKGPGNRNCTACVNVRDGSYCVSKCPDTKCNHKGECIDCTLPGNDSTKRGDTDEEMSVKLLLQQQNLFLKAIAVQLESLADTEHRKADTLKELTDSIKSWATNKSG